MKYLLTLLIGVLLGAACAGALVYFNPLIDGGASPQNGPAPSMDYALSGDRLLASAHAGLSQLPATVGGAGALWERGVRGTWLQSFTLTEDDDSVVAVATKLIVPQPSSNLIHTGLLTEDHWLITLPGRGTLSASGTSNVWPLLRDTLLRTNLLRQAWSGAESYPMLGGNGTRVVGASGELGARLGTLAETVRLSGYEADGFGGLTGQVAIALD